MKIQAEQSLAHVRARDLMRKEVLTLAPGDTIESALRLFEEEHIGGAPVVGSDGRLVGVLTLSDIARPEHVEDDRIQTHPGTFDLAEESGQEEEEDADPDEIFFAKEGYSPEIQGHEQVSDWMVREVISIRPDASLGVLCDVLMNQGIHRVFVTEGERLVGVVSSMDVVRCLARRLRPQGQGKDRG